MDKDFEEFVIARCTKALAENKEYIKMERNANVDNDTLQTMAEKTCYCQGYQDAINIILNHKATV